MLIPMKNSRVLIIDDDIDVLKAARLLLKQHVKYIETESNPQKLPYLLGQQSYDVIFQDMNFSRDTSSGSEGFYWLNKIQELDPEAVVVPMTPPPSTMVLMRAAFFGALARAPGGHRRDRQAPDHPEQVSVLQAFGRRPASTRGRIFSPG
jgi:two-component system, NtrC family, response regulator HydG